MTRRPSAERPVGGSALRALTVVKPPKRHLRAYAALVPKAAVLALGHHLGHIALQGMHDVRRWIDPCTRRGGCLACPLVGPLLE